MKCYPEEALEQMAAAYAEASPSAGTPSPAEADAHLHACFRCRDLFAFYLEVATAEMPAGSPNTRILALRELTVDDPAFDAEAEVVEPLLKLAADTGEGEDEATEQTFVTADHYLVRVHPNQGREGSTAYLVLDLPNQDIGTLLREYRAALELEGTEFAFSPEGEAALPTFPVAPGNLILRRAET